MKTVVSLLAACSVAAFSSSACAQTTTGKPKEKKAEGAEIVVTGRFIDTASTSATKQNISALDTPFSVSSYTNDFMKAIHTTQVADLYRYMTGLQKAGATGYDLTLRGFSTSDSDRNTILVDGLPGLAVRFGSPPTIGTDHVEVVKGAASLLYGAVQPGGFVNMITKKPQPTPFAEIGVRGTIGASDLASRAKGGDISFDSTGPLGPQSDLLYRLVAQVSSDDYFRHNSYERGVYISPSLTWNVGSATSLTAQVEFRQVHSNYANVFLLAPLIPSASSVAALADIRTNYISPTDFLHEHGLIETLTFHHAFSKDVKWTVAFRNVDHHDSASAYDIVRFNRKDPTFQTLDLRARGQQNHRTYVFGDTFVTIHAASGILDNRLIVGASLGKEVDDFNRTQFCVINAPDRPNADPTCNPTKAQYTINVMNPDFSGVPPLSSFGPGIIGPSSRSRNYVQGTGSGVYASDLIGLGNHMKVSLGLRYAHEDQYNYADLNEPAPVVGDAHLVSSAWLPQAGLIYEPDKHLSFYTSYSTSFSPVPPGTQGVDNSFNFKPTLGKGYEIGAKTNLAHNALTATLALFQIDQTNVIVASSNSSCTTGSCSEQIGAARSKGLEFEFTARPLKGWSLIGGWAHTIARVTKNPDTTSGPLPGSILPNSPIDAVHLWSRYDFPGPVLKGFGFGLGYSFVGDRVPYLTTVALPTPFIIPSYQVVDAGLYYSPGGHFEASMKIGNLFNATYFSSGTVTQSKANIVPGTPRTVSLELKYHL